MRLIRRLAERRRHHADIDWLIVGLGNPGPEYAGTRHSIGHEVVTQLAESAGERLDQVRHRARFGLVRRGEHRVCLAMALTYMNESGQAVAPLVRDFGLATNRLLVVTDDMDLPLGAIRLRAAGGSGGHRGVSSVIRSLGCEDFGRLRIGIGRPPPDQDPADYVLSRFRRAERDAADDAVRRAVLAVESVVGEGIDAAMNAHNG